MSKDKEPLLKNSTYDLLQKLVQLGLPAVATLYLTFSEIWGIPNGPQVAASVTALALFFGVLLRISNKSYIESNAGYDGVLTVNTDDPSKDVYAIELNDGFEDLKHKEHISIKIAPTVE